MSYTNKMLPKSGVLLLCFSTHPFSFTAAGYFIHRIFEMLKGETSEYKPF